MFLVLILASFACKKEERQVDVSYNPEITASNFSNSTIFNNPYFHFELGKKYIFEGQTKDGFERIVIEVLPSTRTVMGITCAIVSDKVWIDNVLLEDTHDWYAQDDEGNVWYFGEVVTDYNPDGTVADHDGSWEAGVDGAKPGITMLAQPQVGNTYRQEYYFNEAEDEAKVVALNLSATVPFGAFENCLKTEEWTDLEPGHIGYKIYAPGIGMIQDGDEVKLIDIQ